MTLPPLLELRIADVYKTRVLEALAATPCRYRGQDDGLAANKLDDAPTVDLLIFSANEKPAVEELGERTTGKKALEQPPGETTTNSPPDAWVRIQIATETTSKNAADCDGVLCADAAPDTWRSQLLMALELAVLRRTQAELRAEVESHRKQIESLKAEAATWRREAGAFRSQANKDALTGLQNLRGWREETTVRMKSIPDDPLTVIIVDLDHFKLCNDSHGHPFGDQVLASCGQLLRASLRKSDLVARVGGDEFAALLAGAAGAGAEAIVERIHQDLSGGLHKEFGDDAPTVSVGAAEGLLKQFDELYQRADAALLEAKQAGRNQARWG